MPQGRLWWLSTRSGRPAQGQKGNVWVSWCCRNVHAINDAPRIKANPLTLSTPLLFPSFQNPRGVLRCSGMNPPTLPIEISDPLNARILAVSEDNIQGFQRDPFGEIARLSGVE